MMAESSELSSLLAAICPVGGKHVAEATRRLDSLTKPIGSLGRLETIAAQMFSIFSGEVPLPLRRAVYVFAADHGVTSRASAPIHRK